MERIASMEMKAIAGFEWYFKVASSGGLGPACFQAGRRPLD
jgi:hypothetical protein